MNQAIPQDRPDQRPSRRRWWLLAVLVLGVCGLIGLGIFWLTRPPRLPITPQMEQVAAQALQNPGAAPIDLNASYYQWYPSSGSDYAVEDGMVIFPQPVNRRGLQQVWGNVLDNTRSDRRMPALVYAPDGRTLPASLGPPPNQEGYYFMGDWFLYRCYPDGDHPLWWQCTLLVGGNI